MAGEWQYELTKEERPCFRVCPLSYFADAPKDPWKLSYETRVGDMIEVVSNKKNRLILSINKGREITVIGHVCKKSGGAPKIFALDRNCYHDGMPLDEGFIEEVPIRVAGCKGDDQDTVVCINCPLHNRHFDLETGDKVAVQVTKTEEGSTGDINAVPQGCYQRIHEVHVRQWKEEEGGKEESWIFVEDSLGYSNPLQVKEEKTVYIPQVKLPGDHFNAVDGSVPFSLKGQVEPFHPPAAEEVASKKQE